MVEIPVYERHTGEYMLKLLKLFLDVVPSDTWSNKYVALSTDGARSMTERVQYLVTFIQDY